MNFYSVNVGNPWNGYVREGIVAYIYRDYGALNTYPLYRLFNGNDNFYTISSSERNAAEAAGWTYQDRVYVFLSPGPNRVPMHRFYMGGSCGDHGISHLG